ncbi:conserved hypothetical protein [Vibrio crassostreae]|uniref:hypothetical protein n=1 Tax=Vibrio crassostreae TaxID=246167 RepID=UPI00104A72C0|nr:hypothetical protein [Vibrio crassostreae]TCN75456.1 hypothetical protein EDB37_10751 [Vibrio crassostreae]CAK2554421.1 conserved hypothetical protein [Vibrio crassostreae]CAK2571446.1 conserved hypothetical protein [Vibrio crassostreae]CAK2782212.1 conserved hypothetical protein [Vibrio crassostreae]CAK3283032.1 conserved hypothetical protein [Vibrio crassostreae]
MDLDQIFQSYSSKMTQLCLYQRAMQDITKKELEKLAEYENLIKKKPELKEHSSSNHLMAFRMASNGEHYFYGHKKISPKDKYISIFLHKNKQYQWLLSEAYEEFEDCIESLYAYAGFTNNNFWPLNDYGNITLSEIKNKDFNWFEEQAINKKGAPTSIINKFRSSFFEIEKLEEKNELGVNLRLAITLVELLRHVIVHRGGTVLDKSKFRERVLKKSGLYNNGKVSEEHSQLIDSFFGSGDYDKMIVLLEVPTNPDIPLDTHINVLDLLIGYLMAYIHIIYESLKSSHNKSFKSE